MTKLKLLTTGTMGAFGAVALLGGSAQAQNVGQDLLNAVTGGKVHIELRPRYGHVNDDAHPAGSSDSFKNANAFTMRSILGYETGRFYGFGVYAEAINVSAFGGEAYNSTLNGKTERAVEADPETTEVNQIYLSYEVPPNTTIGGVDLEGINLKYGRQHIALQDHRWIGDVGWRQKPQMYDGASLTYTGPYETQFFYSYLYNVNRPTAQDSPASDIRLNGHLINLDLALERWTGIPVHLIGYGYLFDYDKNEIVPSSGDLFASGADSSKLSNKTFGVRLDGAFPFAPNEEALTLLYTAEYANQSDYAGGDSVIDANYIFGQLGVGWYGVHVGAAYEVLGGDGKYALQTPFQTTHAMNGWADRFAAVIPADGLNDIWFEAGVTVPPILEGTLGNALTGIEVLARYHDFSSDHGSTHYGSEFDIQAGKQITEQLSVLLQYANYWGDSEANAANLAAGPNLNLDRDVEKYWVMADFKF